MSAPAPRVLYIAPKLPTLSETFVYRELLALRAAGVDTHAASVHAPGRGLGDPALEALADEAFTIYGAGPGTMLAGAMREVVSHPVRATGTLLRAAIDALTASDLPLGRRPKVLYQALGALRLASWARAAGITRIHAHMAHVPTTIAMYAARQLGVPFSFTGHANDLFPQRGLLRQKLERAAFTSCISHWHRAFYREVAGVPEAKLPIVRCGVDVPSEPPSRANAGELRVVAVGRLIPKKGFDLLIDAIAGMRDEGRGVRCSIVGGGPEQERLRAQIDRLRLADRVELLGSKPNRDTLEQVDQADLFVLPCRVDTSGDRDGIPVALMEAMARRVCVVSGDLPAIRELIDHERTGLLVTPGDAGALAQAMTRLIVEPDLRLRLADAGRAWVSEEFSTPVNTRRLLAAMGIQSAFPAPAGPSATMSPKERSTPCVA